LRGRTCVPCAQARNAARDQHRGRQMGDSAEAVDIPATYHATRRADARLPPCSPSRTDRTGMSR
jgi:hypothetical protein